MTAPDQPPCALRIERQIRSGGNRCRTAVSHHRAFVLPSLCRGTRRMASPLREPGFSRLVRQKLQRNSQAAALGGTRDRIAVSLPSEAMLDNHPIGGAPYVCQNPGLILARWEQALDLLITGRRRRRTASHCVKLPFASSRRANQGGTSGSNRARSSGESVSREFASPMSRSRVTVHYLPAYSGDHAPRRPSALGAPGVELYVGVPAKHARVRRQPRIRVTRSPKALVPFGIYDCNGWRMI